MVLQIYWAQNTWVAHLNLDSCVSPRGEKKNQKNAGIPYVHNYNIFFAEKFTTFNVFFICFYKFHKVNSLLENALVFCQTLSIANLWLQLIKYSFNMTDGWFFSLTLMSKTKVNHHLLMIWEISLLHCRIVFEYWKNLSSFCTTHKVWRCDINSLICTINIFSITFLSLDNKLKKYIKSGLYLPIYMV